MKKVLILATVLFLLPIAGQAQTLTWDANTEPDIKDYGVYMCFIPGCTVAKNATMLQSYVNHPTTTYPITALTEGRVAVTARDQTGNESGLSVSVPFDAKAPRIPTNPAVR